jgi:membrane peptidoglycan carboxypeptidase
MSENNKMLGKIRALLALAEDPAATGPEAEAFMAKAAELMAKYGIDRALLGALHPETDKVGDKIVVVPGPYAMGRMRLLHCIAVALGVRTLQRHRNAGQDPGTVELHMFGMESDLERVEILYTSLLLQVLTAQTRDAVNSPAAARSPRKWKRDYIEGFATVVHNRLKDAEDRARRAAEPEARAKTGKSMELVLVDRKAQIDRRFAAIYPNTRTTGSRRKVGSGYFRGNEAGRRADLGGSRVGSTSGRTALAR